MRSNARTTFATYCLLSVAGGVSFIMPDSLETPAPPRPIDRIRRVANPAPPTSAPQESPVDHSKSAMIDTSIVSESE